MALPAGLTINATTGAITGAPIAEGANTFTVKVVDSAGLVVTLEVTITVQAAP